MTDDLVIHPRTAKQIAALTEKPAHAITVVGARGSGKRAVTELLAKEMLALTSEQLEAYPYFLRLNTDEQATPIEAIRELQHFTGLKTVGERAIRRIIAIFAADHMSTEAQNALLKLLEEPPTDTVLVLTIENEQALLPTIMSRTQTLTIHTPIKEDVQAYFLNTFDKVAVDKAYFLSGGLPGLMRALLSDDQAHPLLLAVTRAKELLQKPSFERLVLADSLSRKKEDALYVLQALHQIAETGLAQASAQGDTAKLKRWHGITKATYQAKRELAQNANTKLALTNLMLSF